MQRRITRFSRFEDILVGCVTLIAAGVCALALLDVPAATATRSVSYTEFVRAPALEQTLPVEPIELERPRVAEIPVDFPATGMAEVNACSPDARAELERLLRLCQG